ncbi:MAG: ATP-binding protein [bacterium]|nr:ATP-binding protein [bacterium]
MIALIGPNGSGKSTWLRALAETIRFAVHSYGYKPGPIPRFPAFMSDEAFRMPTCIEAEFDAPWLSSSPDEPNRVFRYKLELLRGAKQFFPDSVGYEALHDFPQGRPRRLMERRGDEPVHVAKELSIRPSDDRLASVPGNASVLSTLSRMGVKEFAEIVSSLDMVQMNVTAVDPIRLDTETVTDYFRDNPQVKDQISDRLGRFDLGIQGMDVQQWEDGKWHMAFPHFGLNRFVPFESESAGTRHVVHAFPALNYALETHAPTVMDALDNDLHADLVDEILSWFRREDTNPGNAQLICSLHSLSVLDELEKEEVFIVEKSREGVTDSYGVRDVQGVRRSSGLRKLYRSGALGGLPRFG